MLWGFAYMQAMRHAAVVANCTLPNGTVPLWEVAINAYSAG